nr:MAG TPA: hypothetical protein [Caudoviricetes sp.]
MFRRKPLNRPEKYLFGFSYILGLKNVHKDV